MADQVAAGRAGASIVAVAESQHGVISTLQLRALGLSRDAIRTRVEAGWLARLHRGVYAVGPGPVSWRGRWLAAVLACGEGAVLSHSAAAALWKVALPREGDVEITVPGEGGRGKRAGIRVHRSATLTDQDRDERDGIPVTSVPRTIVDLARAGTAGRALERLLDEAEHHRLLDPSAFNAVVHLRPGPLPLSLRSVLERHTPGTTLTRSELEERFLALCREAGLPAPLVNAPLLGLTVDFLWPAAALVVEVDGRASHDTRRAFEDDRDRDSMLTAAGFRVMRFTWRDVTTRPAVVEHRLRRALGA